MANPAYRFTDDNIYPPLTLWHLRIILIISTIRVIVVCNFSAVKLFVDNPEELRSRLRGTDLACIDA